jgi:hypothetical protein
VVAILSTRSRPWTYTFNPRELVPEAANLPIWEQLQDTGFPMLTGAEFAALTAKVDRARHRFDRLVEPTPWGNVMLKRDLASWQKYVTRVDQDIQTALGRALGDGGPSKLLARLRRTMNRQIEALYRETSGANWWRRRDQFWKSVGKSLEKRVMRAVPPFSVSCAYQELVPVDPSPTDLAQLDNARRRLLRRPGAREEAADGSDDVEPGGGRSPKPVIPSMAL